MAKSVLIMIHHTLVAKFMDFRINYYNFVLNKNKECELVACGD